MSELKATPGPWDWWDDGTNLVRITEASEQRLIGRAVKPSDARLICTAPELYEADGEALDTFVKLRADLAEEDAERHAQRIAVIDLEIERLTAARARARGDQ